MQTEIKKRFFSALLIGSIFIYSILFSNFLFICLLILVAYFMLSEWHNFAKNNFFDLSIGSISISLSIASLIILSQTVSSLIILVYFTIIWSTDTFAMVGGKLIGGVKLAPQISPNKTWSGLITGILSASLITYFIDYQFDLTKYHSFFTKIKPVYFAALVGVLCQASDLFVSIFKRKHRIKDSGSIIPGHGGFLDRFDSIILSSPFTLFLLSYFR